MTTEAYIQVCTDLDQNTGDCLTWEWLPHAAAAVEPWLTLEIAAAIAGATGALWAVAFVGRILRFQLEASILQR